MAKAILGCNAHSGDLPLRGDDQCALLLPRLLQDAAGPNGGRADPCRGDELTNENAEDYAEYGGNDGDNPVKVFHWSLLSAVLRGLTRGNRSLDQPTGWGLKATALATRGQTPREALLGAAARHPGGYERASIRLS